ncbi:circumsporozoite protein-like [Oryza brachyantha]|uniref:circumsporozoite protein-like n=1 Tax=Oryza brachyantha TaxID=4533 RepID=UPI0003EABB5A|nr:circumsporozoite protein-like [Oryza brachyantha]
MDEAAIAIGTVSFMDSSTSANSSPFSAGDGEGPASGVGGQEAGGGAGGVEEADGDASGGGEATDGAGGGWGKRPTATLVAGERPRSQPVTGSAMQASTPTLRAGMRLPALGAGAGAGTRLLAPALGADSQATTPWMQPAAWLLACSPPPPWLRSNRAAFFLVCVILFE